MVIVAKKLGNLNFPALFCRGKSILSGQKLIKNAKNDPFWRVFENLKLAVKQCYQIDQVFIGQKLVENAKIKTFKCDILSDFQTV